jgi:hypothetical protein
MKEQTEQYQIKYNFQKEDGFWVYGATTVVCVPITNPAKEKCQHNKAEKIFLKVHPKTVIVNVIYI